MRLEPPVEQYLEGANPTHCALQNLEKFVKAWDQDEVVSALRGLGHIDENGKFTKHALVSGVADLCEKRVLWNIVEVKKAMIAYENIKTQREAMKNARKQPEGDGQRWVDLNTIGTYFGVSNIVVGKWLDQLGLREVPKLAKNSSGSVDMLDVARQAQQKQATGFIGKRPTAKALDRGVARLLTVTNHKKKEVEITQWNLDLTKAVLVQAGHELDTERKMLLKGKGRNGDVQVRTIDDRARELLQEYQKMVKNPATKDRAMDVFKKQPRGLLVRVEALVNRPGWLTK